MSREGRSESLTSDSTGELHVLGHDGDSSGVDSAEVGVFEETNEVSFSSLLESEDGGRLESEFSLEFVSNVSDESLERELSDEEISGLLVLSDFSESNGAGSESVGFLDSTGGGGGLSSGLGSELLSGGLGGSGFSSSLFSSSHFYCSS